MSEPNTESYAASKGGIVALTHALAVEPRRPTSASTASARAGSTYPRGRSRRSASRPQLRKEDHAQHPAGRVGRPEDIAAMVAYLIGPDSGFITGANFVVDGGMTRKMIYEE